MRKPPLQRPLTGTVTLEPDPVEKTYLTRYLHGQATLGEWEGGAKGIRNISLQMTLNGSAIIRSESKTKAIRHLHISHSAPYLPLPLPPLKRKKILA